MLGETKICFMAMSPLPAKTSTLRSTGDQNGQNDHDDLETRVVEIPLIFDSISKSKILIVLISMWNALHKFLMFFI